MIHGYNYGVPTLKETRGPILCEFNWMYLIHNLRNSLGAVSGFFECYQTIPDVSKNLTTMMIGQFSHASEKALQDIDDAGKLMSPLELNLEPVHLETWLRGVVQAHPISQTSGLTIDWCCGSNSQGRVQIDKGLMERAMRELLNNSQEAMPQGGKLAIECRKSGQGNLIQLLNTGEPIPATDLTDIWEPFFTTKHKKAGLGLSWVRKIIEGHGGRVGIKNLSGRGVQVEFRIP